MVYTEPISTEELINHIEKKNETCVTNDILIVGCGVCANISCSYFQNSKLPAMNLLLKPLAIEKEVDKIASRLKEKYITVDTINIMGLCGISEKSERKILQKSKYVDTIIIMGCPGGLKAVESYIHNKKFVMGMRVKGFVAPKIKLKLSGVYTK